MQPAFFSSVGILSFLIITTNASPLLQALSPRADAVIPGYTDEGCYTEATNMRALTGGTYFDDLMTVEKCAAACSGYTWFGVEYGRECYCGDTINTGSVPAPSTDCNFQCPGDATENCGAGNRLNMYSKASTAPATETLTTYSALGCYTEATTGRALVGLSQADNTMTVEQCASICSGFTTFGVEWYRECYCGNTLMPGSVPAPSTDCKYACDGNSSEICGGDWRLNVYQFNVVTNTVSATATASTAASTPTAYAFVDCYTEATNMRALSLSSYYDDAMTVEKCAAHCAAYTYFGVEYSRECYCGNSINSGSVPAPIGDCSFPCLGNGAEQCGGSNRLDLYQYGAVQSSTTPTLSTSTLLSSSSTSPSASTIVSSSSSQSESSAAPTSSAISTPVSSSSASDIAATTSSTYLSSSSSIAITTSSTADLISSSSTTDLPTSSSSVYFSDSSSAAASSTLLSSSPSIISSSSSAALSSSSSIVESSSITQSSSPSSTFATSTSQSSSIVITSSSAMTTSTFSSTSSSTSSSTTSSTTTSGPTCATPLADAGFEATTAATVPWAVKYPATSNGYVTFNFQTPSTTTTPHGGSQVGAISYKQYSPALQSWFNQPITLCPNTVYNFSAFHKVSIVNPACNVYYYIGSADSNTVLTIFSSTAWSQVTTAWKQVTATYTSGSTTDVTFNIRLTCSTLTYAAPSYYFDDISFVAA